MKNSRRHLDISKSRKLIDFKLIYDCWRKKLELVMFKTQIRDYEIKIVAWYASRILQMNTSSFLLPEYFTRQKCLFFNFWYIRWASIQKFSVYSIEMWSVCGLTIKFVKAEVQNVYRGQRLELKLYLTTAQKQFSTRKEIFSHPNK